MSISDVIAAIGVRLHIDVVVHKKTKINENFTLLLVDRTGSITSTIFTNSSRKIDLHYEDIVLGQIYRCALYISDTAKDRMYATLTRMEKNTANVELLKWYETTYKIPVFADTHSTFSKNKLLPRINFKGKVYLMGDQIVCKNNSLLTSYSLIDDNGENIHVSIFGNRILSKDNVFLFRNLKCERIKETTYRFTVDNLTEIINSNDVEIIEEANDDNRSLQDETSTESRSSSSWFNSINSSNNSLNNYTIPKILKRKMDNNSFFVDTVNEGLQCTNKKKELMQEILDEMISEKFISKYFTIQHLQQYLLESCSTVTNSMFILPSLFHTIRDVPDPSVFTFSNFINNIIESIPDGITKRNIVSKIFTICSKDVPKDAKIEQETEDIELDMFASLRSSPHKKHKIE